MRNRNEIEDDSEKKAIGFSADVDTAVQTALCLEVLLDIRYLLQKEPLPKELFDGTKWHVAEHQHPPEKDELFEQARHFVELHIAHNNPINAKKLAYLMTISYGRASALIDQLEAAGVINPKDANGRRKVV